MQSLVCVPDVYLYNVWQSWTDKPQVGHKTGEIIMFDICNQVYVRVQDAIL